MNRYLHRNLLAVVIAVCMLMSGFSCVAFAEGESSDSSTEYTYKTLSLDSREDMVFDDENYSNKYYTVSIAEEGYYRMYVYSTYHNSYNDDFWIGFYGSKSGLENDSDEIDDTNRLNLETADTDILVYYLKPGTYYFLVKCFDPARNQIGVKMSKTTETDMYALGLMSVYYTGMKNQFLSVGYSDPVSGKYIEGKITSVVTGNKNVIGIKKSSYYNAKGKKQTMYTMDCKKSGKAKLTVKFKTAKGKTGTIRTEVKVKKYPAQIKSLKVNGKKVNTSKKKYLYEVRKYKKASATVKMKVKAGWKVQDAQYYLFGSTGSKNGTLKSSVITGGKKISFPKKYSQLMVTISMTNKNNDYISYTVTLVR